MRDEPIPYTPGSSSAQTAEQEAVHDVYEAISPHFHQTRRKPWPLVVAFLDSLPPHTIGLDAGAGNGNHLPLATYPPESAYRVQDQAGPSRPLLSQSSGGATEARNTEEGGAAAEKARRAAASEETLKRTSEARDSNAPQGRFSIALDHSQSLLSIARGQLKTGAECLRAELGFGGWRQGVFDWAINIAAIHHLTTHQRRLEAVTALLRPLVLRRTHPYSRFFLYVWAYEQGPDSKRKMGAAAEARHLAQKSKPSDSDTQPESRSQPPDLDSLSISDDPKAPSHSSKDTTGSCSGAGEAEAGNDGGGSGTDYDSGGIQPKVQDVLVPWVYQPPAGKEALRPPKKLYHRYYHLFTEGELRALVEEAARMEGFTLVEGNTSAGPDFEPPATAAVGVGATIPGATGETGAGGSTKEENKWLRLRGVGYELDNWWLEGEVGVGDLPTATE